MFSTKIKKRPYSIERLSREFALQGNKYVANLLAQTLKNPDIKVNDNTLILGSIMFYCNFKFALISCSDIASAYQTALQKNCSQIIILGRGIDRQAMSLTVNLPVKIEVLKTAAVYKFLNRKNALPKLEKEKYKFSFKYIFDVALKRSNAKFYVFSGVMLLFLSFFTPLKLYYLCFGTSLFLLAILCLSPIGQAGDEKNYKAFDILNGYSKNANDNDNNNNDFDDINNEKNSDNKKDDEKNNNDDK